MNFMKNLAVAIILILSTTHLIAQNKEEQKTSGKRWYVKGSYQLSDTQALTFIEYPSFKDGILLVNNKAAIQWEILVDGNILGISKHNGHPIVFYNPKSKPSEIYVATIDLSSQKITDDKLAYKGKKGLSNIQNDAAGNFSQLVLRKKTSDDPDYVKGFVLITLNADGSAVSKDLTSIASEGLYVGDRGGKDGCVFIASIAESVITVEKFSHEGALVSKLQSPLNMRKTNFYAVMNTDAFTNNGIVVNLRVYNKEKDRAFSYHKFNFDDNQVATFNEAPLNKTTPYKFSNPDELRPLDVLFTTDKIVMVREVIFSEAIPRGNSVSFLNHSQTIVVSIFDKQMKLQREILLDKFSLSYSSADNGITAKINKNKLYILSSEGSGSKFDSYCYTVNLNDGQWQKRKIGTGEPSITTSIYAEGTIWLTNEIILSQLHIGLGAGTSRYKTVLESVGYDAP